MPKIVQGFLFTLTQSAPYRVKVEDLHKAVALTPALDFGLRRLYGGPGFPPTMPKNSEELVRGELLLRRVITDRWTLVRIQAPSDYFWKAGQHLSIFESPESTSPSYYSIASARHERDLGQFDLFITEPSNLFAPDVRAGAPLWLGPAQGGYPLGRLEEARLVVLVAMGTGIAPLRAVAQHLINLPSKAPAVRIVHGIRQTTDAFLQPEFLEMGEKIEFVPVVSLPSAEWSGRAGRVQAHLEPLPEGPVEFCVCGSMEMVQQVKGRLLELGADAQCIHSQWG